MMPIRFTEWRASSHFDVRMVPIISEEAGMKKSGDSINGISSMSSEAIGHWRRADIVAIDRQPKVVWLCISTWHPLWWSDSEPC